MKKILLLLLLISHYNSYCQNEKNGLADINKSIEKLVPENWRILKQSIGDLNGDGTQDICLALQKTDQSNYELNDGLGIDTVDLNPRMLTIYFGKSNGAFEKKIESTDFILLQGPTMDEPLKNIEITKNRILEINFSLWYSAGSWSMSDNLYKFKYQNNQFELINYQCDETHRGSGESTYYDVNFEKKRIEIIRTTIDEETEKQKAKKECKKFKLENLKTIRTLGKPFEWELNGLYI